MKQILTSIHLKSIMRKFGVARQLRKLASDFICNLIKPVSTVQIVAITRPDLFGGWEHYTSLTFLFSKFWAVSIFENEIRKCNEWNVLKTGSMFESFPQFFTFPGKVKGINFGNFYVLIFKYKFCKRLWAFEKPEDVYQMLVATLYEFWSISPSWRFVMCIATISSLIEMFI